MVDKRKSPDDQGSVSFSYLGVRIYGAEVWTTEHETESRYLGPLRGA